MEKYPGIKRLADLKNKPRLVRRNQQAYPDELRQRDIKGAVRVAVVISPKSKVVDVRVINADHPDLVDLAIKPMQTSKFSAGREKGRAIYSQLATRVRIGGNDEYEVAPQVCSSPLPEYPYYLRRSGLSRRVKVEFIVNMKGRVEAAYAVETSYPAFRQSAT